MFQRLVSTNEFPESKVVSEAIRKHEGTASEAKSVEKMIKDLKAAFICHEPNMAFWTNDLLFEIDALAKTHFEPIKELVGMDKEDEYMNAKSQYATDVEKLFRSKRAKFPGVDGVLARWAWLMSNVDTDNLTPLPLMTENAYRYFCDSLKQLSLAIDCVSTFTLWQ